MTWDPAKSGGMSLPFCCIPEVSQGYTPGLGPSSAPDFCALLKSYENSLCVTDPTS